MHNDPTEAQIAFLRAWYDSHRGELLETMGDYDARNIHDLSGDDANTVLAIMTAQYGEPKKGDDADSHDDSHERTDAEGGEAEGDGIETEGNGNGAEGNGGDGGESGDGEGNGDGKPDNPYRQGSKEQIIADALIENNMDTDKTFDAIAALIGTDPLVFEGNIGGGRAPLPMGSPYDKSSDKTQNGRAKKTINDVRRNLLNNHKNGEGERTEGEPSGESGGNGFGGGSGEPEVKYEAEILLDDLNNARAICDRMNADGEPFDTVGLRPYVHGPKMLDAGFPRQAILDAMTMTWPKEVRRELNGGSNLPAYDQRKFPKAKAIEPMPLDLIEQRLKPLREKTNGRSLYLPAMIALAETRTPILQVGEKGTGKTTNAEHLAQALAERWERPMPFGFASMTSGTSPGEFKGRITLQDFLPSLFCDIYENGGVYLFDELDAGDENLLTLLNMALANGYFVDQKGNIIKRHPEFVPVAAANTMGLGATSRYTGRNRLDGATLDRWAMGRIRVEFDANLAEFIYWNNLHAATVAA